MSFRVVHAIDSIDPREGGEPAAVAGLAQAQAEAGLRTTIAFCKPDGTATPFLSQATPQSIAHNTQFLRMPLRYGAVVEVVRQCDAVHVHGTWRPHLALFLLAALRLRIPTVLTPHGNLADWPMSRKTLKKAIALALCWRWLILKSNLVIALNPNELTAMERRFPGIRGLVIPNGIALARSVGVVSQGSSRPYVLFLSHLGETKRPDLAVEAFSRLADRCPDLDLVIAGPDKGMGPRLRRLVTRLGIEGRVRIPGGVYGDEKQALLANALCLCHPSRHEACSMSILEALANGIPVITTREACMPSLERTGAGKIVEPTPESIAKAILEIASDSRLRESMARAGRKLARSEHAWADIERRVFAAYETAIKGATGSAAQAT